MKKRVIWLIFGIVIGILVSIAACWIWCCCYSSCETSCRMNCVHVTGMDSVREISVDSATTQLQGATVDTASASGTRMMVMSATTPPTALNTVCANMMAFSVNRQALAAMNTLAGNTSVNTFRVYLGYNTSGAISSAFVVGVNSAGKDITTPTYTIPTTGVGPCPDVCDATSPYYHPNGF